MFANTAEGGGRPPQSMVAAVRTFLTFLLILALIGGAIALYLYVTTPHETAGATFPLSGSARAMIASAPASAAAFAYIPRAAALEEKLNANPITRDVITSWSAERALPQPWMLGGADLLVWQSGKQTRYLLRLDPVRAALVRIYLMAAGDVGGTILINAPSEQSIAPDEVAQIEALTVKLPTADAVVVQRTASRGAFPPIGRPVVSSVAISKDDIVITSHAQGTAAGGAPPLETHLARGAMLSASFASAPRLFDDLNRLFGQKISDLVSGGGSVSIYDVDTGTLLPRPRTVISVPASANRRPASEMLSRYGARTAEKDGELVLSFDDTIDAYLKDAIDSSSVSGGRWAARIDVQRLAPILDKLKDNVGLRIASPRLFRAARDLDRWIENLHQAKTITATDSFDGTIEELKAGVTAK